MSKVYLGNETYEVYLSSGKRVVLTSAEMDEIAEGSEVVQGLNNQLEAAEYVCLYAKSQIEEIVKGLKALEFKLIADGPDAYERYWGKIDEAAKLLEEI